uniref:Uncharacterized protein n=1 Tax=Romanomermis culicivorax TaxID=13658 RepID=A0A915HP41_ROMCU
MIKGKTTNNDANTNSATKIVGKDDSATKIVKEEEKFVDATKIVEEEEVVDATKIVKEEGIDATIFAGELSDASEDKKKQSAFKRRLLTSS